MSVEVGFSLEKKTKKGWCNIGGKSKKYQTSIFVHKGARQRNRINRKCFQKHCKMWFNTDVFDRQQNIVKAR